MSYADEMVWPSDITKLNDYMDKKFTATDDYSLVASGDRIKYDTSKVSNAKVLDSLKKLADTGGVPLYGAVSGDTKYNLEVTGVYMPAK